jgi:hypothetical protein
MSQSNPNGYSKASQYQSAGSEIVLQDSQVQPQPTLYLSDHSQHNFHSDIPSIAVFSKVQTPASDFNPTILPPPPILRAPQWGEGASTTSLQEHPHMPSLRHAHSLPAYPSPSDTNFGSPSLNGGVYQFNSHAMQMPPPMPTSTPLH